MPSTVFVTFDAEQTVQATARRMHAALGRVLDLPEGISAKRAAQFPALAPRPRHDIAGPKPYSLGQMNLGRNEFGIELRFLDDALVNTLDAWLAWGGVLPIGSGRDDAILIAREASVIETATWDDICATDDAHTWDIEVVTPVVFSAHGTHHADLTPASLAVSLHARWRKWDGQTMPELPSRSELERILTVEDHTHPVTVDLGLPSHVNRGRVSNRRIRAREGSLRVSGRQGEWATAVFSQLMALSRFTNVGSHASFGMGVIDVVAE